MADNQEINKPSEENPVQSTPSSLPTGKKTWPELVGLTAEEAERKIKEEKPSVTIQLIPPDRFVTMDIRQNRVRVYLDSFGKVARAPTVG